MAGALAGARKAVSIEELRERIGLSQAKAQSAVNPLEDAAAVDVRPGGRSRPRPAVPTRARRWAKPSAPRSAARRSRNPGSR